MYLVFSLHGELKTASEENTNAFSLFKDMDSGAFQLLAAKMSITKKMSSFPKLFFLLDSCMKETFPEKKQNKKNISLQR